MKKYFLSLFITAIAGGLIALAGYKTIENKHLFSSRGDYEMPTKFTSFSSPINGQDNDWHSWSDGSRNGNPEERPRGLSGTNSSWDGLQ